ncbi:hypothetical protein ACFSGX_15185 [Sphingomonas arantia]|uniref:DUF898 domain-containing protein n=1 Tax=Sphingomonas arantia TaxID=1460676 RepID=A0ABW4U1F4_9SPHN
MSAFAAPLVVALTGMFYLGGYIHRQLLLSFFGISPAMFTESIQTTIARGYISVLLQLILIVVGAIVVVIFNYVWRSALHKWFPNRFRSPSARRVYLRKKLNGKLFKTVMAFGGIYQLLIFGALSGMGTGTFSATRIVYLLNKKCANGCYAYHFGKKRAIGILLLSDNNYTMVQSIDGTRIFATKDLTAVHPYGRPSILPPI